MNTWHIHIKGRVQGVGFRPFVYQSATNMGLNGNVCNTNDGVHIIINSDESLARDFLNTILKKAPPLAIITHNKIAAIPFTDFKSFSIIKSKTEKDSQLIVTPDFAMCDSCRNEMNDPLDRRSQYPFITCTHCGPRYSIASELPYDRPMTEMHNFEMCKACENEYKNPDNPRFHSQTNSCDQCGISLSLFDTKRQESFEEIEDIYNSIINAWEEGQIVAIKAIGGFLLTCDAKNEQTILALRNKKHRPSKPFAVMFPTIEQLNDAVHIDDNHRTLLNNHISPIIIAKIKNSTVDSSVAPNQSSLGVMVPYAPILEILLQKFNKPIIATSANVSNSPIIFQDDNALKNLRNIADYILTNNRKILLPQDDSVIKFSQFYQEKIILRRSRGLAPSLFSNSFSKQAGENLAMGAMIKSTIGIATNKLYYISQYIGDLTNYETEVSYQLVLKHLQTLLKLSPKQILVDLHPQYPTTTIGEEIAIMENIPIKKVQHHVAHFCSVLGEHNLLDTTEPILGVMWDGTGYGFDNQIWGGEFFQYRNKEFIRSYYFDYFDSILGDKMALEPRIAALSLCFDIKGSNGILYEKFTDQEWDLYQKILTKGTTLKTSSLGRIFDGVASLLGIMDKQTYEGEAAMRLEQLALDYFIVHGLDFESAYFMEGAHRNRIPTRHLIRGIIKDMLDGKDKSWIAAKFHYSLCLIIKIVASHLSITKIACSGGVFQNGVLRDLIHHHLAEDLDIYFNEDLSPNDENISFGQLIFAQLEKEKNLVNKNHTYVLSNSR